MTAIYVMIVLSATCSALGIGFMLADVIRAELFGKTPWCCSESPLNIVPFVALVATVLSGMVGVVLLGLAQL